MKKTLYTFFTGVAMGASDIVPGVSGGTIAFISGIYQRLIDAIASFDHHTIQLLLQRKIKKIRKRIDGSFLVTLALGIATSIITLSSVMNRALNTHRSIVFSFFIGLVVASAILIAKNITKRSRTVYLMILMGFGSGFLISHLSPGTITEPTWRMIVGSAMIAICAMILPGISGSFLLVLMGMYEPTIAAVHDKNIVYIVLFGLGAVIGILTFVHLVKRAFTKHHNMVVGLLLGLMIGSVPLLFPRNITENITQTTHYINRGIACLIGIIAIISIDYIRGHLTRYEDKKA